MFIKIFLLVSLFPCVVYGADSGVSQSDIQSFYDMLKQLQWDTSSDTKRVEIFKRVESAVGKLDENMNDLEQNYKDVKENEQSLANRTLTAATTAATGVGGMKLAQGLAEQKADAAAEQDMEAYMATMRCTYAGGQSVKAGPEEVELPGGNDANIIKYRSEYLSLASSLKERKEALGLKLGIEAEEILDKANIGLYDQENKGITDGTYASLYRAKNGSEKDQAKIDADKEKSAKNVKIGGIVAGVGVIGGVVGNLLINGNKAKNKSAELRDEREKIVVDLQSTMQAVMDECNENIANAKKNIVSKNQYHPESIDDEPQISYEDYKRNIDSLTPIKDLKDIEKIKDISVCK